MAFEWRDEQKAAIYNRGAGIAVSAAAGSGKTAVLTARIIERLCSETDTVDLSRLAIMTYTEAAAKELRERIGAALESAVAAHPESKRLYRQLLLLPSAHISTVHGFCLELIRTHHQTLGLPSDMRVADETQTGKTQDELLDTLIADYYAGEIEEPYAIEDFSRFDDIFGDRTRDEVLKKTVRALYDSFMTVPEGVSKLETYIAQYREAEGKDYFATPWGRCVHAYLCHCVSHYRSVLESAVDYIASVPEYGNYLPAYTEDKRNLLALSDLLCADPAPDYRTCRAAIEGFRLADVKRLPNNTEKTEKLLYYADQRKKLKSDFERLSRDYLCFSGEDYEEARKGTEKTLCDLYAFLSLYEKRFAEEKKTRRLLTFSDMEHYALALLWNRETDSPSDLARSIREEYDEIYVDEFQDTNLIQQKIYRLISKEDAFFCVGDVKQSIYGFRGTDTAIFEEMLASRPVLRVDSKEKCGKILLSCNFRSTERILSFCNGIFEKLMNLNGQNRYGKADRLVCGVSGRKGEKVEICLAVRSAEEKKKEKEQSVQARVVAEKIQALLGTPKMDGTPIRPRDIAILLRKTSEKSEYYINELQKRGIPCTDGNTKDFFANAEVLLAYSLLQTVVSPTLDIPLAATLKSPIYGFTLDELIRVRRSCPTGSLFEALSECTEKEDCPKGKRFLADHKRWRALSSLLPCDRLIWQIFGETAILSLCGSVNEKTAPDSARRNLLLFYRWSGEYAGARAGGLLAFLRYIEEAMKEDKEIDEVISAPADAVSIMTVHKSKGLEFPVVFFAETDKPLESREAKPGEYDPLLGPTPLLPHGDGFTMLKTPFFFASCLAQKEKDLLEETRVLYVALTRARERLIIVSECKETKKETVASKTDLGKGSKHEAQSAHYSYYMFLRSSSFFDMMFPVLRESDDFFFTAVCPPVEEASGAPSNERAEGELLPSESEREETEASPVSPEKAEEIVSRLRVTYPFEEMEHIPSKLSVSKLYPDVLDGVDAEPVGEITEEEEKEILPPLFLREGEDDENEGARRGTAMHSFMQFFDLSSVDRIGVEAEADRLVKKGFLFPADREKLNFYKLKRFFLSPLAQKMREAKEVFREKRFLVGYPAAAFSSDESRKEAYRGEELLVQGIIDCVFVTPGDEWILVDYKTDSFPPGTDEKEVEKILKDRHSRQLGYYRYACEKMFHNPIAHTLLYSFALGREVEIFPEADGEK